MEHLKRWVYLAAALVCLLACAWLGWKAFPGRAKPEAPPMVEPEPATEPEPAVKPEELYTSPVDFAALQEKNPDIYAWLTIPNTHITYPVLQHPQQDEFYLDHNDEKQWAQAGALFSQASYNGRDFSDPVTIIYGHRQNDGSMFGDLQPLYLGDADYSDINEIVIYLPEAELHYRIFAAVPHSNEHILYMYDFSDSAAYQRFLDTVYDLDDYAANYRMEDAADTGDRLLILETCLQTNRLRRFLVIGKLVETLPTTYIDGRDAD